jgi:hypothetical protein
MNPATDARARWGRLLGTACAASLLVACGATTQDGSDQHGAGASPREADGSASLGSPSTPTPEISTSSRGHDTNSAPEVSPGSPIGAPSPAQSTASHVSEPDAAAPNPLANAARDAGMAEGPISSVTIPSSMLDAAAASSPQATSGVELDGGAAAPSDSAIDATPNPVPLDAGVPSTSIPVSAPEAVCQASGTLDADSPQHCDMQLTCSDRAEVVSRCYLEDDERVWCDCNTGMRDAIWVEAHSSNFYDMCKASLTFCDIDYQIENSYLADSLLSTSIADDSRCEEDVTGAFVSTLNDVVLQTQLEQGVYCAPDESGQGPEGAWSCHCNLLGGQTSDWFRVMPSDLPGATCVSASSMCMHYPELVPEQGAVCDSYADSRATGVGCSLSLGCDSPALLDGVHVTVGIDTDVSCRVGEGGTAECRLDGERRSVTIAAPTGVPIEDACVALDADDVIRLTAPALSPPATTQWATPFPPASP